MTENVCSEKNENNDSGIGVEEYFDLVNINQDGDNYDVNFETFFAGINSGEKVYEECKKMFEIVKPNFCRENFAAGKSIHNLAKKNYGD